MEKIINFHKPTTFLGRNGNFKSVGISITESVDLKNEQDVLRICPITSKNEIGRSTINVPKSEIPAFIEVLKSFSGKFSNLFLFKFTLIL